MQINKLIAMVRALHPCVFDDGVILHWLSELDGQINTQVHLLSPVDLKPYEMAQDGKLPEVQLLVPYPYDSLYVQYLLAQLHYYEGEYDKYQNAMQMYNLRYTEYVKWVCENIAPASGEAEQLGYYLSAYALAVKHGYEGSEEEWLASLKGPKGDKGEPGSGVHYIQIYDPDDYNRCIANIQQDGVYIIESADYLSETYGSQWSDRPQAEPEELVLIVSQFGEWKNLQIAVSHDSGRIYTRFVLRRIGADENYIVQRDWKTADGDVKQPVILAIGDSICRGANNGGKGFVGELGFAYVNKAADGAAFTKILPTMSDKQVIGNQLTGAHAENVCADIVIVEGGANDYKFGAELDETLNAVEDVFNLLYKKYPLARKLFLLTHKTKSDVVTAEGSAVCDWTTTENLAGYTFGVLFEKIRELCEAYAIEVIDVFTDSELDTNDDRFVSKYSKDDLAGPEYYLKTAKDWVASDGLHPLAYGYSHAYLPVIRRALFGG